MKNTLFALLAAVTLITAGCTENIRSKAYGGTMTISLPKGQKLVTATWKEQQLWYLTRPMRSDEQAETSAFVEKSSLGLVEGKVLFVESK